MDKLIENTGGNVEPLVSTVPASTPSSSSRHYNSMPDDYEWSDDQPAKPAPLKQKTILFAKKVWRRITGE